MTKNTKASKVNTIECIRRVMSKSNNIRNMSIISHGDEVKSALTGAIRNGTHATRVSQAVIGNNVRPTGVRDVKPDSTGVSLYCETSEYDPSLEVNDEYLINIISCPPISSSCTDVTAALRTTDGAVVVVDSMIESLGHLKTVIRPVLGEMVKPVLILDDMDKCFESFPEDGESVYKKLSKVVENANSIIEHFGNSSLGDVRVCPRKGTVGFSSSLHGWAFTLRKFAKMYASTPAFPLGVSHTMEHLWGDHFYDETTQKWTTVKTQSLTCKRGFVMFCYEPIRDIIHLCRYAKKGNREDKLQAIFEKFSISVNPTFTGENFLDHVMQTWVPSRAALLEMAILHLPSPVQAQSYTVENLYMGPLDDQYAKSIRGCDPNGPLILHVSKKVHLDRSKCSYFGRIFSGKILPGAAVAIIGQDAEPDNDNGEYVKGVHIWRVTKLEEVEWPIVCGNIISIVGLNKLTEDATLIEDKEKKLAKWIIPRTGFRLPNPAAPNDAPNYHLGVSSSKVGYVYDERMCSHYQANEPECPERIKVIYDKLVAEGISKRCNRVASKTARFEDLRLVHSEQHIKFLKEACSKDLKSRKKEAGALDSIYLNDKSEECAALAAGSVVHLSEKVASGELTSGIAIVRPPGHHAEPSKPRGFCLYANIAIAAKYLLSKASLNIKKILIVDFDIHHGNGTQEVFEHDNRVLFFSIHRYGKVKGAKKPFYPGKEGSHVRIGKGSGVGFNINLPWENDTGFGDADYAAAFDYLLIPIAQSFDPDIVLVSAGFDAAPNDPLGDCCVSPYGYYTMIKKLMKFANGKVVLALEGGYDFDNLANSVLSCFKALLNDEHASVGQVPVKDSTWDLISKVRTELAPYWPSSLKDRQLFEKIAELDLENVKLRNALDGARDSRL